MTCLEQQGHRTFGHYSAGWLMFIYERGYTATYQLWICLLSSLFNITSVISGLKLISDNYDFFFLKSMTLRF